MNKEVVAIVLCGIIAAFALYHILSFGVRFIGY